MEVDPVEHPVTAGAMPGGRFAFRPLFVAAILSGSFLLFLVQPMIARMALPRLGGAPAVWNSAMLVYQALLLGGYAYAHWLGRFGVRRQATIHLAVLIVAAMWLPIGLMRDAAPSAGEAPVLWVPWLLFASIGPLFLAISAQAPLLQRWFAASAPGVNPYALYAASNIGSFAGLIAYPLLVEPSMALSSQSWLWTGGYVLVVVLVLGCAIGLPRLTAVVEARRAEWSRADVPRVAEWMLLALVPSGLMLATSTFLTTDIVAVPLLWVLPLGLYLLSFSVAFATNRRAADFMANFAPATILVFGGVVIGGSYSFAYLNALVALILLFMVAVALHTRLYRLRPEPERLTGFYLAMAAGGALGGVFAALLAPALFDWTYEYPIMILAAGLLAPQTWLLPLLTRIWSARRLPVLALVAALTAAVVYAGLFDPGGLLGARHEAIAFLTLIVVGLLLIGARPAYMIVLAGSIFLFGGWLAIQISLDGSRTRSYFGVYTLRDYPASGTRTLAHGTTLHGVQFVDDPAKAREPTTYYVPGSGIGQAMAALPVLYGPHARVGAVGLGTGTLACYATSGQDWRFYEIDPAVVKIARDSGQFGFLSRCLPQPKIVIGDARLSIAGQPADSLDLLALDAFSSDAVPMHLMTREALAEYARVLGKRGLLMVHVSNRFLDLEPVVTATAKGQGWYAAALHYVPTSTDNSEATMSDWIALSRDPEILAELMASGGDWQPLRHRSEVSAWTDDYASIVPVLNDPLAEWRAK